MALDAAQQPDDLLKRDTGRLSGLFAERAAEGFDAAQFPALDEPDEPAFVSLEDELRSGQYSERGIQALLNGTREGIGANTYHFHGNAGRYGDDPDSEEKKENKLARNMRALQSGFDAFKYGNLELSGEEALDTLDLASKRILKQQAANTEAARLDITTHELKTASKSQDTCVLVDGRPIEDIAIVDGYVVDTELYYQMEIQNQELSEQYERAQQFTIQLEAGDVTWEQVPDDVAAMIAEEHELQQEGPQTPAPDIAQPQPTVLEQLENLGASMQDVVMVKPSVSFTPM